MHLKLIEHFDVGNELANEGLQFGVNSQVAPRKDLLPTLRTLFLVLPIVVLNAFRAKFMKTILYVEGTNEHV